MTVPIPPWFGGGYPATIDDLTVPADNPEYGKILARQDSRLIRGALKISFEACHPRRLARCVLTGYLAGVCLIATRKTPRELTRA